MRSWILLIALSAILALATACGSDDDGNGDDEIAAADSPTEVTETPTPEPEESAEPEPTPTEIIEEPDPTATPEELADEPEPSGNGQTRDIEGLLLSLDDLPSGWTETLDAFDDDMDMDGGDVADDPFDAPCGIQPLEEVYEPVAEADRSFQGTELGPYLSQNLVQLGSSDQAAGAMGMIRELFACDEWIETDEFGDEIVYVINEVPFDGVGDDSFGIRLGMSFFDDDELDMFGDFGFDMVFLHRAEYISIFIHFDLFGMGTADIESLVRRADEKLQAGA
jgi:hypothetical protein